MSTVNKVRITSSVKTSDVIFSRVEKAESLLKQLNPMIEVEVVRRRQLTITELFRRESSPVIVINSNVPLLYFSAEEKIYYHENTMRMKVKRYQRYGEIPPLIEALSIPLDKSVHIVDATMGMGNDLMLMAHLLPHARLYAYEQHLLLFFVISEGIKQHFPEMAERIQFHYGSANPVQLEEADIVYIDPMFEKTLFQDSGMQILHKHMELNSNHLLNRVTSHSRQLIMKAHYQSPLFEQYEFDTMIKRNSRYYFGIKKGRKCDLIQ